MVQAQPENHQEAEGATILQAQKESRLMKKRLTHNYYEKPLCFLKN